MVGKRMEVRICLAMLVLVVMCVMAPTCHSAPSFNPKPSWRENGDDNNAPILASSCDPITGRCWSWPAVIEDRIEEEPIVQPIEYDRAQPIHARDVDLSKDAWRDVPQAYVADNEGIRNLLPTKKSVFVSKGWAAGGMPFSVLYMSNRATQPTGPSKPEGGKNVNSGRKHSEPAQISASGAGPNQPNYRVAVRNGSGPPPRRHYSIIPQLFISYGWGPSGK